MKQMLYYTLMAVGMISLPMLVIGVFFSVLQAATQINEMTITFIPKLVVMFTLLFLLTPWLMNKLVIMTQTMMMHLPLYLR
ncbi:MAG TPA: flagellar biosynthetic protein FliQ [Gammaproteobacteria bacterium]|nr:flagellar biosynthetic protein FliQ [Gammaproteobacteria bacterium]